VLLIYKPSAAKPREETNATGLTTKKHGSGM
jgi:hypothetical protein